MKNLQKFTKAELISRIKGINNNNPQSKLLNFINFLKSLIIKFTFLALIIKIFKRFKILRRVWLIINTSVMAIFGISVMDLYGLSFISAFYAEIKDVTGNIILYLSNTKFYSILTGILGYKVETPTKMETMSRIQPATTNVQSEIKRDSRITSWFEKEQEVIKEDTPFYEDKYFLLGSLLVITCVTYYFFGDEIKVYSVLAWDWLRGRNPGNNPGNPPINPQDPSSSRMNTITNFLGLNKNKGGILETVLEEADSDTEAIQVTNNLSETVGEAIEKRRRVRISPSFEKLSIQAKEGWDNSKPISPIASSSSSSSTETIKPISITELSNKSFPKSINEDQAKIFKTFIGESVNVLDQAFDESGHVLPFLSKAMKVKEISELNWLSNINPGIRSRIDFIENVFADPNELEKEVGLLIGEELTTIIKSYEAFVELYGLSKEKLTDKKLEGVKLMAFYMRSWISSFAAKIYNRGKLTLLKGNISDSPKAILKDILDD